MTSTVRSLLPSWLCLAAFLGVGGWAADVPAWRLDWTDEFNQADGSAPSTTRWSYDYGGTGWGNQELQYYTYNLRRNARIEGGCLVIEAHEEPYKSGSTTWYYTSARLKTQGKAAFAYGRIEARMKLPCGQGLWPALWMLGVNYSTLGWPACGELDIMEHVGREPATVHGAVHGPGYSGVDSLSRSFTLSDGTQLADRFHLFAVEWEPEVIRWSVDNRTYYTLTPASLPTGGTWVFDHSFFIIVNLAVGGRWPGAPDATTVFPQRLTVDYIRVYERILAPAPSLVIRSEAGQTTLSWPAEFPQARLQQAATVGSAWTDLPLEGRLENGAFTTTVSAGIFRLR